jgi:hypothetical protein
VKPAWAQVKLRVASGDVPEFSDELHMASGRRYQVIGVRGKTLTCLVLPPDAPIGGRVIAWQWAPRRRRAAA